MSKERISVRVDAELLESFNEHHPNRAAAIRGLMRKSVAEQANELPTETLAQAYNVLVEHGTRFDNGAIRCTASEVAPIIANRCNVEGGKEMVKARVFRELRRKGYIRPRAGFLWVKPRGVDPVKFESADNAEAEG